jgi:hypothetical protein
MSQLSGLLVCKPDNAPSIGSIESLSYQRLAGQSGKSYLRFKRDSAQYGGHPFRILTAEKTDYSDQHGNVSFNISVSPDADEGVPAAVSPPQPSPPATAQAPLPKADDQQTSIEAQSAAKAAGCAATSPDDLYQRTVQAFKAIQDCKGGGTPPTQDPPF